MALAIILEALAVPLVFLISRGATFQWNLENLFEVFSNWDYIIAVVASSGSAHLIEFHDRTWGDKSMFHPIGSEIENRVKDNDWEFLNEGANES